jgi:hypothetical protein
MDHLIKISDPRTTAPASEEVAAPAVSVSALQARLDAWFEGLCERDAVWRELQSEKAAGWASAAVEAQWRRREQSFSKNTDRSAGNYGVPSTRKYVAFYQEWLPRLAPDFFYARRWATNLCRRGRESGWDVRDARDNVWVEGSRVQLGYRSRRLRYGLCSS